MDPFIKFIPFYQKFNNSNVERHTKVVTVEVVVTVEAAVAIVVAEEEEEEEEEEGKEEEEEEILLLLLVWNAVLLDGLVSGLHYFQTQLTQSSTCRLADVQ